jgi:hypothetical protein
MLQYKILHELQKYEYFLSQVEQSIRFWKFLYP